MVQVESRDGEGHRYCETGGCEKTIVMEGGWHKSGYEGRGGRAEMYSPTGLQDPGLGRDLRRSKGSTSGVPKK